MKIFLLVLLIAPTIYSQWEVGASYKIKSDIPENGFGFNISRNIPYQGATFGIKVRAEVNLFRQTVGDKKFNSEDYNLHIKGEYFFRYIYPYFGLGLGYGELRSEKENWNGIVFSVFAGSKFPVSDLIKPYIEIQVKNCFANYDPRIWGSDISSFQFRGAIGINISINTLSN